MPDTMKYLWLFQLLNVLLILTVLSPISVHHPVPSFPLKCVCYYGDRKIARGRGTSQRGWGIATNRFIEWLENYMSASG